MQFTDACGQGSRVDLHPGDLPSVQDSQVLGYGRMPLAGADGDCGTMSAWRDSGAQPDHSQSTSEYPPQGTRAVAVRLQRRELTIETPMVDRAAPISPPAERAGDVDLGCAQQEPADGGTTWSTVQQASDRSPVIERCDRFTIEFHESKWHGMGAITCRFAPTGVTSAAKTQKVLERWRQPRARDAGRQGLGRPARRDGPRSRRFPARGCMGRVAAGTGQQSVGCRQPV